MSEQLPDGWAQATLGDIAKWGSGGTPSRSNPNYYGGDISWVKTGDLGPKTLSITSEFITAEGLKNSSAKIFPKGSVAIAMYGATIGKTSMLDIDTSTNQACAVAIPLQGIDRIFTYYLLNNEKDNFIKKGKGGAQPNISQEILKEHLIKLPPENEQIRIAEKLDSVLAKVDAAQTRLKKIPTLLKRFRQSVLAAATSGELTREWRALNQVGSGQDVIDADTLAKEALCNLQLELKKKKSTIESEMDADYIFELPETWRFTTWGKMSEWITYGFTRPMPKTETGTKLLTAKDIQYFSVEIDGAGLTTDSAFNELSDKDRPKTGDLLITKDGSIGRAALVRTNTPFCINQSVAVCWLRSTSMDKDYLELTANSDFTQKFVKDKAQGMAIQHLSIIDYAKCPLPVPPLKEQKEIVRRVESLFTLADTVEKQYFAAKQRTDKLTQSLLAKAFRGELVPQDPNDEPAAELLKRIQAERMQQATEKPKRKVGARSSQNTFIPKRTKTITMQLIEAPENYLLELLAQLGGETQAEVLWKKSELAIDDFYAKLKQEMQANGIVEDKNSPDPALRKLKVANR